MLGLPARNFISAELEAPEVLLFGLLPGKAGEQTGEESGERLVATSADLTGPKSLAKDEDCIGESNIATAAFLDSTFDSLCEKIELAESAKEDVLCPDKVNNT